MILRIRLGAGRPIRRQKGKNRGLALVCGALLAPASLMAYVLGVWRLAADLGFAGEFGLTGTFSHWQLWMGIAVGLHYAAHTLNRYAQSGRMEVPEVLSSLPALPSQRKPD